MLLTEPRLIFRGIKPLQRLGALALSNPLAGLMPTTSAPQTLRAVPPDPWPGDSNHGRDMVAGIFHFAGQTISKEELSWQPEKASPEWIAELHSFEWLRNLRSVGGERARRMAREMVATWMDEYPSYHEMTWRADILGMRLKSWISFHDFFCASADEKFRKDYFASLLRQTKHLARTLPGNTAGIPLLQAYKGLAYTGLALEGGEKRLEQALDGILAQVHEQILPDGGHISRNPQSTFEFLQCLVDLRAALIAAKAELPEALQEAIDRIAPAVKFFRHGDGSLAQFNGGREGNPHLCETTLMHSGARGKALQSMPHSGYERISQGRASLIMDTGLPLGSAHSAQAHAGLLSFEYCFGRDRVIINCGSSAISGKWRRVLRATLAHSTLVADHRNSCPFDADGLMSNRCDVRARRHEDNEITAIDASHNGYVPRFGLIHHRRVQLLEQGDVLRGEDQLAGKSGVPFAVRFHLHPDIEAEVLPERNEIMLYAKSGTSWRFSSTGHPLSIEESIYAGSGETPRPCLQIVLSGQTIGSMTAALWEMRREEAGKLL